MDFNLRIWSYWYFATRIIFGGEIISASGLSLVERLSLMRRSGMRSFNSEDAFRREHPPKMRFQDFVLLFDVTSVALRCWERSYFAFFANFSRGPLQILHFRKVFGLDPALDLLAICI